MPEVAVTGTEIAHAWTKHRREKAAAARRNDFGIADRLARGERIARNPAGEAIRVPSPRHDIVLIDISFGPDLPGEILRLQDLPADNRAAGNQHGLLRRRGLGKRLLLSLRLLEKGPDQHGSTAGEGEGDDKKDQSACAHCLLPAEWKHILDTYWLKIALAKLAATECLAM
jgi:hypothetical protein